MPAVWVRAPGVMCHSGVSRSPLLRKWQQGGSSAVELGTWAGVRTQGGGTPCCLRQAPCSCWPGPSVSARGRPCERLPLPSCLQPLTATYLPVHLPAPQALGRQACGNLGVGWGFCDRSEQPLVFTGCLPCSGACAGCFKVSHYLISSLQHS